MITIGDYVVRKSYRRDILFKVTEINSPQEVQLKGITYRILADSPIGDLELAGGMRLTDQEVSAMEQIEENVRSILMEHEQWENGAPALRKTGKVLHIDGDAFYLKLCLKYYEILGVDAVGENVLEFQQPKRVRDLIERHNPDILVLTGHDSLNKKHNGLEDLKSYRNSKYFVNSVREARSIRPTSDQLVIYAGACQSHFEAILAAGADYASSPDRVLIHALDPPFVVERIAYCPFYEVLQINDALKYTITQFKGMGGYEILGKARKGGPVNIPKKEEVEDVVINNSKNGNQIKMNNNGKVKSRNELNNLQKDKAYIREKIRNQIGNSVPLR